LAWAVAEWLAGGVVVRLPNGGSLTVVEFLASGVTVRLDVLVYWAAELRYRPLVVVSLGKDAGTEVLPRTGVVTVTSVVAFST
jgi:hypothetical protein